MRHGGDGIVVEDEPVGSDPIPEAANLPTQHCFVTSYGSCLREQAIKLHERGFTPLIMDTLRPKIEITEW